VPNGPAWLEGKLQTGKEKSIVILFYSIHICHSSSVVIATQILLLNISKKKVLESEFSIIIINHNLSFI